MVVANELNKHFYQFPHEYDPLLQPNCGPLEPIGTTRFGAVAVSRLTSAENAVFQERIARFSRLESFDDLSREDQVAYRTYYKANEFAQHFGATVTPATNADDLSENAADDGPQNADTELVVEATGDVAAKVATDLKLAEHGTPHEPRLVRLKKSDIQKALSLEDDHAWARRLDTFSDALRLDGRAKTVKHAKSLVVDLALPGKPDATLLAASAATRVKDAGIN